MRSRRWTSAPGFTGVGAPYHRELLGELSRAAETAREPLAMAAGEEEGFRSGVVSVVQTFGERANFHPHVHALVTRGGWTA